MSILDPPAKAPKRPEVPATSAECAEKAKVIDDILKRLEKAEQKDKAK